MATDSTPINLTSEQRIMLHRLCSDQSLYYSRISVTFYKHDDLARRNCIRLARFWKETELCFHSPEDEPEPEPEKEGL